MNDINTAAGMLKELLFVNKNGVAFVKIDEDRCASLPRWMWGHCKRALADAEQVTLDYPKGLPCHKE